jgi:hypothetical protein
MPSIKGMVYEPAPNSLKTDKLNKRLSDESAGIPNEKNKENLICKKLGGYISVYDRKIACFRPEKSVFLHHKRPKDKSVAHATKEKNLKIYTANDNSITHATEDDGEFYSYEALSEGQQFIGSVIGNEKDLEILAKLVAKDSEIKIGRSRTAQYGKATIEPTSQLSTPKPLELKKGGKFRIVAITPLILENEYGVNTTDLRVLAKDLGDDFEIIERFCTETTIAGYYGKWLLPKTQQRAIAEGSVIVFKYNGNDTEITDGFVGLRNGEGFGQYKVERVPEVDEFELSKITKETMATASDDSKLKTKIQRLRDRKSAAYYGTEYAEKLKNPPKNSGLVRIITSARESSNFDEFAKELLDIKQSELRVAALAFVTAEEEGYFKTDPDKQSDTSIAALLKKRAKDLKDLFDKESDRARFSHEPDYDAFVKYLQAAVTWIKQKRRSKEGKGGESNV